MMDSRDKKLKISVLSSNLLENDGDHGKGLLKRKQNIPSGVNFIMRDNILSKKSLQTVFEPEHGASGLLSLGSQRLKKDFGGNNKSQTSQMMKASDLLKDSDQKLLYGIDDQVNIEYPNPATGYKKVVLPNLRDRDR